MPKKKCGVCGNQYDRLFEIKMAGKTHVFDCFECAITALAPMCSHCKCKVIGHGVEVDDAIYCSTHCAREEGIVYKFEVAKV